MFDYEMLRLIWWALLGVLLIGFGLWRSLRKRAQGTARGDLDGARVPKPTAKEPTES